MEKIVVFDVETKYSFREVKNNTKKLGVSVVAAHDYETGTTHVFAEQELNKLFKLFERASVIVGYNSLSFDLVVLNEYYVGDLFKLPHFDILENIREKAGRRYALDDLIQATLNKGKTGHGLLAIQYYREGEMQKLRDYCADDVNLTKELFDFGLLNGYIFLPHVSGRKKLLVDWKKILTNINQQNQSHNLTLGF